MRGKIPIPEARPERADQNVAKPESSTEESKTPETDAETERAYVPPPIEKEDAELFASCIADLKTLGVEFSERIPQDEGDGCGIDHPLQITSLGKGIRLQPEGTMRCGTALALALWTHDVVAPMLGKTMPGETLAEVNRASTYICRKRNNSETGKISEHAHGNAVDVAGFTFISGKTFMVAPRLHDSTLEGAFQRAIAASACLYFSTVLDPSSDKAHETHLHLDTMKRKNGFRYCW